MGYSYLDLVNQVDSFPSLSSPQASSLLASGARKFKAGTQTIGFLLPSVVAALEDTAVSGSWWTITADSVSILGATEKERTANIRKTVLAWHEAKKFAVLSGWRDELYSVYAPAGELYLVMERSATPLFGVVTYGVHMTAYVSNPMRLWTPRRNVEKHTYGGMLDNTVAGGIASGMGVLETLVKESQEEASLPENLVKKGAKAVGAITYFYERDQRAGGEVGLLQPEVQFVYDLEVDESIEPAPCDDEVQEFYLWDMTKVRDELKKGNFKPNCAIVLIDFFVRHGIITPENEPDYLEIVARIHRNLEFPLAKFGKTT